MLNMEKESKKAKSQESERRKRKRTASKKDEKKSRGKQKKIDESSDTCISQENQQDKEGASRPTSPENCSICLGDLQNKSFTDSCFHMFCFVCLKEWSKVKAECPLCKQKFKNIIYNVSSYEKFDRYNIEEEANKSRWERDGTRFRYRTTLTFERRLTIGPEHNYTQPIARPSNVTTRSHWRRHREPATSEFRRRIYTNGMQAEEVTDRRLRVRDTTPNFYRQNPATMHRLVPWLNRELNSLLQNQPDHVQLVIEIIMGLIKSHSIDSEEFYQHVYPYVGRHTRHFMHEFSCFAKSPYNMIAYDALVVYQPGPVTLDSDSNDSSVDIDDEYLDEIIDIEDENSNPRSPQLDRRGNHPLSSVSNLSPLFRSVRDILEAESPASSMTLPLSVSGWDSPTPGPSWLSLAADLELPISNATDNIPVEGNRASSPIDIASTSDSDSDSTQSADSNGSDIVFVKVDKPWEERSPIMLSSDSSDVERNLFLNFEHKHYNFKKKKLKKEHKKHKEHKKDSQENSKDRHKHKKRKKHHSSDKSHRHSSKHRDSCSSRSSSKHGENEQSTSKTKNSEVNLDKSSEININTEKHHHKKLKKHKDEEQRHKSKSSKKLKSVIVLPTAGNNEIQNGVYSSSESLFPSDFAMINHTSTLSSQSVSPYKKHSSGHKKSSKLIDIVPKLLDKLNTDSSKSEVQKSLPASSDQMITSTVTSCKPNNLFVPFHIQTSDQNGLQKSKLEETETELKSATNITRESAPYHIEDSILSLENSRRCLKCGLLYIPELLDNFDICFTCKKKKVCETESRGFSNRFSELFQDNIYASTPRSTNTIKNEGNDNQDNTDTKSCQESSENIVIQEGTESSLRPVLNQVDLTSINGPLLDISESESDDCELIVTKSDSNIHKNDLEKPLCIDITKQIHDENLNLQSTGRTADATMKSLLQDNTMSDPSNIVYNNPSKTSQSVTMASQSPLSWTISNSPTPFSGDWPGYMAPSSSLHSSQSTLQPIFPYSIPSIYSFPNDIYAGHRQPIYSNSDFMSGYSSRNCSSFIDDLHADNCSQKKPIFIDLDDHKETITTSALPVFSSEKICLSDSEDSTSADIENVSARTSIANSQNITSTKNVLILTDSAGEDVSDDETAYEMDTDQDSCDTNNSLTNKSAANYECNSQSEKYECSENVINDVDMTSTSEWLEDALNRKENQSNTNTEEKKEDYNSDKLQGEKFDEENELSTSDLDCEMSTQVSEVPTALDKKLEGMTEFSSSVLQGIEKDNRLTFHNILSEAKCGNPSKVDNMEKQEESKLLQSNQSKYDSSESNIGSLPNCPEYNTDNFSQSNSLFVQNSEYQMDNLVSNMNGNLNSIDEFEIDSLCANSASMNSKDNFYKFMNENSSKRGVRSPTSVTMETDPVQNIEMNYDSSMSKPFSLQLFSFEAISGSYVSDSITQGTAVISPEINNQLSSADGERRSDNDKSEENGQENMDNDDQLTIDDDHQDTTNDTENLIGSNLTEFSSESDRENDFTNGSDDSSSSKTVKFRVDILHSERDLSDNFANIFESSDSN